MSMAPVPTGACNEHSGVCQRVRSLEARTLESEETIADLHDRVLVGETRVAKGADIFGRYIWPIILVIVTAAVTRYLGRQQEQQTWQKDYSLSPSQSSSPR